VLGRRISVLSRRLAGTGVAACAVAAASACGAQSPATDGAARAIRVRLKDFAITAPSRVRAGAAELVVRNAGPTYHEFLVVTERRRRLPFRADGLTVDEEQLEPLLAGEIEPFASGTSEVMRVSLRPGRYVLLCNMSGHYLGGMRKELVVEP
jgi:uncharacterized cupredoxin-like copper-binding protein